MKEFSLSHMPNLLATNRIN